MLPPPTNSHFRKPGLPERKAGIVGLHPIIGGVLACSGPAADLSLLVESAARE